MGYQMSQEGNVIVIAIPIVATTNMDGQHLPKEGYHGLVHSCGAPFFEFDAYLVDQLQRVKDLLLQLAVG